MTLALYEHKEPQIAQFATLEEATAQHRSDKWQRLAAITVQQSAAIWLQQHAPHTQRSYRAGLVMLADLGLLDLSASLQAFSLLNHNTIVDRIKHIDQWSECTRQARAACYISFARFLHRWTEGVVPRVAPCRDGAGKTFYKVREKVATEAMTRAQWTAFLDELQKLNPRDCLIAKIILQGGKRVQEALSLATDRIHWDRCEITFTQSKTRGAEKETVITYPQSLMHDLHTYIGDRTGLVFITRTGKALPLRQLANTFYMAGRLAGIPFKVTPHVLRASTVTYLKQQGFSDSDIMRVTGHASAEMIYAYDKSSRAENASKKVSLVT